MLFLKDEQLRALLRSVNDFGFEAYDLASLPRRLADRVTASPVDASVDRRRVTPVASPARQVCTRAQTDQTNWLSASNRALARLYAAFLVAEDPQNRIEARKAATLMHQVSLVRHILDSSDLRRVLIGDEVGLGKTIEAGLIVQELIRRTPSLRVLYLAPARLVPNVVKEFREKLDIDARRWVAGGQSDARLKDDKIVVASINKAVFGDNLDLVAGSGPWDVVIVDECHHLSDWDEEGGKPNQSYRLVSQLAKNLSSDGRLILLSGTPHQGSEARFKNILKLLSDDGRDLSGSAGRVIFRTKDRVRDWHGAPLFPAREIRQPVVVELGERYTAWYAGVGTLYERDGIDGVRLRAAGWAKGQALQWAASSVQAGVGYLVRLAIRRLRWNLDSDVLSAALSALRPYRGGARTEDIAKLYERIVRQIGARALEQVESDDDAEDWDEEIWRPDPILLAELLREGVALINSDAASARWDAVCRLIDQADGEKVVLFAQPVETVTVIADVLERRYGQRPALIIGNQSDEERTLQVARFQRAEGPRFLVSSKAGGEGLNMQKARRLIHLDVPWNPMDLEQRIGRIHRFGSRKTVIIDTVVAAGSREVDMYQIAREKLMMISKHMDPDQFETLFSRVMSLVPPKELESILGDLSNSLLLNTQSTIEIGRLVTEGFKSWSAFDEAYRKQAEEIRSANPGQTTWADLGVFLVRFAGAKDGANASFSSFKFSDNEIVAVDEQVPSIVLDNDVYVCGDTSGMPAVTAEGVPTRQLGLNIDPVRAALNSAFTNDITACVAFLKAADAQAILGFIHEPLAVAVALRCRLQQQSGLWSEQALTLHVSTLEAAPRVLSSSRAAELIRAIIKSVRIKDPASIELPDALVDREDQFLNDLRRPSEQEIGQGVRYVVWPVALVVLVP